MGRKPLTKPRKQASQDRSRAMVDVLIETTARVLVKDGFDKASTNRIAEKAGVSVGSLYQYFPCKESLVAAVVERHHEQIKQLVLAELGEFATLPVAQAVRKLVTAGIKGHRADPKLHRVLAEQVPRTGVLKNVEANIREGHVVFKAYLEAHRDQIRVVDLELAAFVCVTTLEALTHTAVLHHSDSFSEERFEALVDEATRLIVGYLQ